jgi:hypothetical protein
MSHEDCSLAWYGLEGAEPPLSRAQAGPDGEMRAPQGGPVVLALDLVLPRAAQLEQVRLQLHSAAPLTVIAGQRTLEQVPSGQDASLTFTADDLPEASELVLPELPFTDFLQTRLILRADAARDEHATIRLNLQAHYRLPVESAASYFTYIMTQA